MSCSPSLLGYEQTRVLQDRVVISTIWSRGKRYHFIFRLGSHSGSHMHSPTERKQFHFPDTPCVFKPTSPGTCLYTVFPLKSCHGQPPRIHKQNVVLNHFWDFLYSMLWNDRLSPIETLHFAISVSACHIYWHTKWVSNREIIFKSSVWTFWCVSCWKWADVLRCSCLVS